MDIKHPRFMLAKIFEEHSGKLYLKNIANMEFLSEEHLSRYIKDLLGLSFTQLISLTRCEEAQGSFLLQIRQSTR